jgi:uncharacterized protein (TIGR00255 family)
MTGYASAQLEAPSNAASPEDKQPPLPRLGLEIRAVNSRYLDLSLRLPDDLRACEPALRECLTARLKRGKVELRAALEASDAAVVTEPSVKLLQRLNGLQDTVKAWLPHASALSVADVLRLASQDVPPRAIAPELVVQLAEQVLHSLLQARAREGARLAEILHQRVASLRALAAQAKPLIPELVAQQRQRFLERWEQALQGAGDTVSAQAAQDRALAEATAFAIRIDVAEELTRLQSHLDEIKRLLNKGGEIGKRLDFLIQELHREANTLGSKSAALELTHISVDMKVLIEQMREQVQNIE